MIAVRFFVTDGLVTGFSMSGHADSAPKGSDVVCAAVSSAAYMTVNTITDVAGAKAIPISGDGHMKLVLSEKDAIHSQEILKGFEMHIRSLSKQYPHSIKIVYGGNRNA